MKRTKLGAVLGALSLAGTAVAQCETEKQLSPYDVSQSRFGGGVAMSGDTAVVTARDADGHRSGLFYRRLEHGWELTQEVDFAPVGMFGSHVDTTVIHGNQALFGEYGWKQDRGRVHVYTRQGGVWNKTGGLTPPEFLPESHFGRRMALEEDRAVIAAPMEPLYGYRQGAVFVFEREGGWVLKQRIDPPDLSHGKFFGLGLALEGDLLAIGQPGFNGSSRRCHVYREQAGQWVLEATLHQPESQGFGRALDFDGGRLVVGAYGDISHGGPFDGGVYIFERIGGAWQKTARLKATHPESEDDFGEAVDLEGDTLLVSGEGEVGQGDCVHVFVKGKDGWRLQRLLKPHDSGRSQGTRFGFAMALEGDDLWVGSYGDTQTGTFHRGAVYMYTLAELAEPYCGPANVNSTGLPAELRSRGCGTIAENGLVLEARNLPPHELTVFYASRTPDFVPFAGGSQGDLCIGDPLGIYATRIADSGPSGMVELAVDLTSLPTPVGAVTAVPGETWRFQCWYRDSNPAPTSNATDAVAAEIR